MVSQESTSGFLLQGNRWAERAAQARMFLTLILGENLLVWFPELCGDCLLGNMWRLHLLLSSAWNHSSFLNSLDQGWPDKEGTSLLIVNPQNLMIAFLISTKKKKSMAMKPLFLILTRLWGRAHIKNSEFLASTLIYSFCPCPAVVSENAGQQSSLSCSLSWYRIWAGAPVRRELPRLESLTV